MGEDELKRIVKALHEKQVMIDAVIDQERVKFENEVVTPLLNEHEICGRRMDELLGQSKSWVVGRYDKDGMPVFETATSQQ